MGENVLRYEYGSFYRVESYKDDDWKLMGNFDNYKDAYKEFIYHSKPKRIIKIEKEIEELTV